jgi:hypothetical protein
MNTLQSYTYNSGANNTITVTNGKWYVVNWKDNGYSDTGTQAIFMELSGEPITISTVADNYSGAGNAVTVSITTSAAPAAEEKIFVRYTKDNWTSSSFVQATGSGTTYTAVIPGADVTGETSNQYYVLTTTVTTPTHADADMQTINLSNNSGSNYPLPVELTSFTAIAKGNNVQLAWQTATETNNAGFEVERTPSLTLPLQGGGQGGGWQKVGFVEGAGSSNSTKNYSFTDNASAGKYSYRLKQVDRSGSFKYSNVVEVVISQMPQMYSLMQNYPNPFNPATTISFAVKNNEHATVEVYNMVGQHVATLFNGMANAHQTYTLSFDAKNLPSGIYFYSLKSASQNEVRKMTLLK